CDARSPRDQNPVPRVSSSCRISGHDHLAVSGSLVVDELIARRNHHHVGQTPRPAASEDFPPRLNSLKNRFAPARSRRCERRSNPAKDRFDFVHNRREVVFGYDPSRLAPPKVDPDALVLSKVRASAGPVDLVEKTASEPDLLLEDIPIKARGL